MNRILYLLVPAILFIYASCEQKNKALEEKDDPQLARLKLPEGFKISFFARDVDNARSLALGDNGTVFVGNRKSKNVYALVDADKDGVAEKKYTIASGMKSPNGVAFHKGSLYIAEISKVWKIDNIESNLQNPAKPVLVNDSFPTAEHHGWKYIAFGPDDKLYVPVGAPCNICDDNEKDKRFSSIMRMNADGSELEVYSHGIRNTVGFTWHPETKELWFTDNGRDELGDDIPPDELNIATKKDENFGYPYCHAGEIPDPEFGKGKNCGDFKAPAAKLSPHGAALGIKFNTGTMFPEKYRDQVFIAEHGSWNRSKPIGYRIMMASIEGGEVKSYQPFIEGWLNNGEAWGRPVDVLFLKDGSMLVSDDHANAVYRVTYETK
ncbi:MAG: sorbosone dehydrogenase family protein [Chitinophagaceae bacterium]|nr:sorbosone dehydrogenase family protein [Chitinophagaceae bacterium]